MTGKEALEIVKWGGVGYSYETYVEAQKLLIKDIETLEQYKNTEENFGIDFITLYTALTNGVWVKNESGQVYHTNVYLHNIILSSSSVKNNFCFITLNNELLLFNRIKQDWSLIKEEL